jgi:hypothetical protein
MVNQSTARIEPVLECRELSAYAVDHLPAVRAAFAGTDVCVLRQAWRAQPDPGFLPATVRAGWRGDSLHLLAEIEDAGIFTRATAHNQRMWELGDVIEIFLQPAGAPGYIELHVTPNNFRLQLRFPDTATLRAAQAENRFEHLFLPSDAFTSRTWTQPEQQRWWVHAEIPAALVGGAPALAGQEQWRFSFSRYDFVPSDGGVILSSSSYHVRPDFHRREEWGTLLFRPGK